jgi:hypothetical protein
MRATGPALFRPEDELVPRRWLRLGKRSLDGAKRKPGFPQSATLHAGYTLLIKAGADPSILDDGGRDAADFARARRLPKDVIDRLARSKSRA